MRDAAATVGRALRGAGRWAVAKVPAESGGGRALRTGAGRASASALRLFRIAAAADGPVSALVGGALVLVLGWIVVTLLWDALALLPRTVGGIVVPLTPRTCAAFGRPAVVSDTLCGTLIATLTMIGAIVSMFVVLLLRVPVRRVLAAAFGWLPRDAAFLGPPLFATALFTMGWAGVQYHFRERPGLVSDGLFPVLFGLSVYGLARAWPAVTGGGSLLSWRDRLSPRLRWIVAAGTPVILAVAGTFVLSAPVRDQVVALAALVVGYAMLAPPARAPGPADV